jgi:hypothetical protein
MTFTFTATTVDSALIFGSTTPGGCGPGIDAVTLQLVAGNNYDPVTATPSLQWDASSTDVPVSAAPPLNVPADTNSRVNYASPTLSGALQTYPVYSDPSNQVSAVAVPGASPTPAYGAVKATYSASTVDSTSELAINPAILSGATTSHKIVAYAE